MGSNTQDIAAKMRAAKNIVKACEEECKTKLQFRYDEHHKRLEYYTKADPYLRYDVIVSMQKTKPFKTLMKENDQKEAEEFTKTYEQLREIIYDYYINKRTIPTIASIGQELSTKANPYSSEVVKADLKLRGFHWLPLQGTENSIIAETQHQFNERVNYLQTIMKYREEGRPIVYIDQRRFIKKNGVLKVVNNPKVITDNHIIAASRDGFIDMCYTLKQKFSNELITLQQFVLQNVAPTLNSKTVLVITDSVNQLSKKGPNEYSPKKTLIQWLIKCDIPHHRDMHRAELFQLIEKTKKKIGVITYRVDQLLKEHGFDIVRRPPGFDDTNYFNTFWKDSYAYQKTNQNDQTAPFQIPFRNKFGIKHTYKAEDWKRFDEDLIEREKNIFEQDMQMEEIIDKLMTMAKDGQVYQCDAGYGLDMERPEKDILSRVLIP